MDTAQSNAITSIPPPFLVRYGTFFFFVLFLLLLSATWFIKYPNIIQTNAILTTNTPSEKIISPKRGKLTLIFVKDSQEVKKGDVLGWIESNGDKKEIFELSTKLDSGIKILANKPRIIKELFNNTFTNLGELETEYKLFISALQVYYNQLNGFHSREKQLLKNIITLKNIKKVLLEQNIKIDNELIKKDFAIIENLYIKKLISLEEYTEIKKIFLNTQIDLSFFIQQNQIRLKQKEIDRLNYETIQQQQIFLKAIQALKNSVNNWITQYVIQAHTDGIVGFTLPLKQNQYIEKGELLGYINPINSKYYAEIQLSRTNYEKVDTGMKVQLRFNSYPYIEASFINGIISCISTTPFDNSFFGTVSLENMLKTDQQKKDIQYKNGLRGEAFIVTKDIRLLERIYYKIVKSASIEK